jgi:hypothetical protein
MENHSYEQDSENIQPEDYEEYEGYEVEDYELGEEYEEGEGYEDEEFHSDEEGEQREEDEVFEKVSRSMSQQMSQGDSKEHSEIVQGTKMVKMYFLFLDSGG